MDCRAITPHLRRPEHSQDDLDAWYRSCRGPVGARITTLAGSFLCGLSLCIDNRLGHFRQQSVGLLLFSQRHVKKIYSFLHVKGGHDFRVVVRSFGFFRAQSRRNEQCNSLERSVVYRVPREAKLVPRYSRRMLRKER